ncbi:hypothetical protein VSS37_06025 [Candidatus Thiothrix sp. Deng01]|uniref:Uncharacterized protein n=1 Tax=Candidatus Thiothrix phosphatis TaxID=3112415 RepID=A0ABU6CUL5_9GAMM|nr:hypothetical protein [Candidatus Thiothrix sp. Deng01]MEB4590530.1 hypothetical protein [Candidatus Thiothrix sp. Deng01]
MSNSRIMKEFWGIASAYIKVFALGFVVGVLTCIYWHDEPEPITPGIDVDQYNPPRPGYIPPELQ